jgi:hypothetical protein
MMYKVEELLLMTGGEIILEDPLVKIQQPTIKQIALKGESEFFRSMSIFYIRPEPLIEFINQLEVLGEDEKEIILENITAYDNLLFLMRASTAGGADEYKVVELVQSAFDLLIPEYSFNFDPQEEEMSLVSLKDSHSIVVDEELFMKIKSVAEQIFLLDKFFGSSEKEELSPAAQKIADKIAKHERKIREINGENEEGSYFARILSIMGMHGDLDYLSNLTVYQLHNQFERFNLFTNHNQNMNAALAGASNVELVDWYKKI